MKKFILLILLLSALGMGLFLARPVIRQVFEKVSAGGQAGEVISAADLKTFDYEGAEPLASWRLHEFKGKTDYQIEAGPEGKVLHALGKASSSALFKENLEIQMTEKPFLVWKWKVSQFPAGKTHTALGDRAENDFSGRVYAIFKGRMAFSHEVIQYIWDDQFPEGTAADGFSIGNIKVKMMVIQSGAAPAEGDGWVEERRDLNADFEKAFGKAPEDRHLKGFGLMTDADNTNSVAEAWFSPFTVEIAAPASARTKRKSGFDPVGMFEETSGKVTDGFKAGGRKMARTLKGGIDFVAGGFRKDNR